MSWSGLERDSSALHAESGPAGHVGPLGLMKTLEESDLERSHASELEGSERPLE